MLDYEHHKVVGACSGGPGREVEAAALTVCCCVRLLTEKSRRYRRCGPQAFSRVREGEWPKRICCMCGCRAKGLMTCVGDGGTWCVDAQAATLLKDASNNLKLQLIAFDEAYSQLLQSFSQVRGLPGLRLPTPHSPHSQSPTWSKGRH